jgi:hypothetical protein
MPQDLGQTLLQNTALVFQKRAGESVDERYSYISIRRNEKTFSCSRYYRDECTSAYTS